MHSLLNNLSMSASSLPQSIDVAGGDKMQSQNFDAPTRDMINKTIFLEIFKKKKLRLYLSNNPHPLKSKIMPYYSFSRYFNNSKKTVFFLYYP